MIMICSCYSHPPMSLGTLCFNLCSYFAINCFFLKHESGCFSAVMTFAIYSVNSWYKWHIFLCPLYLPSKKAVGVMLRCWCKPSPKPLSVFNTADYREKLWTPLATHPVEQIWSGFFGFILVLSGLVYCFIQGLTSTFWHCHRFERKSNVVKRSHV